jgi:hypothetical protein
MSDEHKRNTRTRTHTGAHARAHGRTGARTRTRTRTRTRLALAHFAKAKLAVLLDLGRWLQCQVRVDLIVGDGLEVGIGALRRQCAFLCVG